MRGRGERASFELSVRRLPAERLYLMVAGWAGAGVPDAGEFFGGGRSRNLRGLPVFAHVGKSISEYLRGLRVHGDVWAMPEGTLAFAGEPLLRVTAPLIEAQIAETFRWRRSIFKR